MFQTLTFKSTLLATLIGAVSIAVPARATITFDDSASTDNTFQQTSNSPCVIGNPSCNQPSGMDATEVANPSNPYDLFSPVYTATSPFTTFSGDLIPLTFSIGIDDNLATSKGLEVLEAFNTYVCPDTTGVGCTLDGANSFTGPHDIPNNNNGNGFSDMTLNGFSLTAGNLYMFEASVSNDTDGMEQFFIIPSGFAAVPEPVTSTLVGVGLVSLFFLRRRVRG